MYVALVLLIAAAVSLVPQIIRMRRFQRQMRREDPEWVAAWKGAGWSKKRRIGRAMRRGETLYDPGDAHLLVGLSRRADLYQATTRRRLRYSLPFAVVLVVIAIAADDPALAAQAVVLLGLAFFLHRVVLPRQRERRHRTAAANRQIHGSP